MKEITLFDCEELLSKFMQYTDTAEQHEFAMLAMVNMMLEGTMIKVRRDGEVKNQKDARAMFRVVLRIIREDFSEYAEETA